jgi:hypothetical protein
MFPRITRPLTLIAFWVVAPSLALVSPASADSGGFTESTVQVAWLYPNASTLDQRGVNPIDATVGSGITAPDLDSNAEVSVDVTETTIQINDWRNYNGYAGVAPLTPAAFNGVSVSVLSGTVPAITGASVDNSTNLALPNSNLSFTASSVSINMQLEDCDRSRAPIKTVAPHFAVFPEFRGASLSPALRDIHRKASPRTPLRWSVLPAFIHRCGNDRRFFRAASGTDVSEVCHAAVGACGVDLQMNGRRAAPGQSRRLGDGNIG